MNPPKVREKRVLPGGFVLNPPKVKEKPCPSRGFLFFPVLPGGCERRRFTFRGFFLPKLALFGVFGKKTIPLWEVVCFWWVLSQNRALLGGVRYWYLLGGFLRSDLLLGFARMEIALL